MARKDDQGMLVTAPNLLKKLYLETYQKRLKHREIKSGLKDIQFIKEELWSSRLEELKLKKTPSWKITEVKDALKSLKNNKCPDPNGVINKNVKSNCAGSNLEEALVLLFNGIKESFHVPRFMLLENITTIFKNKGSRFEVKNDRGIFILTILKKVLDKFIYGDNSDDIDRKMSDTNIGKIGTLISHLWSYKFSIK